MSLKYISFADLLEIGGNGGDSGDSGGESTVHAGLTVHTRATQMDPPAFWSGDGGDAIKTGGDAESQYPCGLSANDPTVPTVPADCEQSAVEPSIDTTEWGVLDRAYQQHHLNCKCCIAAGRGVRYGLRCGTGAALWRAYSDAAVPNRKKDI